MFRDEIRDLTAVASGKAEGKPGMAAARQTIP